MTKGKLSEPISLRISDVRDPQRRVKFAGTLERKRADASKVLRGLIDAYIESGGQIDFPVSLTRTKG
jgi:hypothetical protein